MQFKLTNINKIKNATIELNGLTIIAGVNDSGKSTIGKMLFALTKAIGNMGNHNDEQRYRRIRFQAAMLYNQLSSIEKNLQINIKEKLILPPNINEFMEELMDATIADNLLLEEKEKFTEHIDITPQQKARILRYLENIKEEIQENKEPQNILKKEFETIIEAEFLNNICTNGTEHSEIAFYEGTHDNNVFISLEKNKIKDISATNLTEFQINDATFVESPLYIHLLDILASAQTLKEKRYSTAIFRPLVNYHVKDMAQKLDAIKYPFLAPSQFDDKMNAIGDITGGKFEFDNKTRNLFWKKEGVKYSPVNVASGIKAFGVMQILMETQAINENKILIWDEPENHLHPEWQIKIAQLFVEIAKAGVPILISSHSPYFIQGVRYFTEKHELNKFVNYYLAKETEDGLSELEDVTKDLNQIFVKLAQPMNEIINIGM